MTAAKNQKRPPLPRLGVFGQPELPATQAAPGRVRWAALTVLLAVCLVCYNYTDLPLIVRHSISFWDALRTGRLNQFYQLATALPIGQATGQTGEVPYDIWVYVLLAVWNLPVYLWELATGLTFETNLIAMVWVRLAGMLPFVGANWAILGIARQLGRPKEQGLWAWLKKDERGFIGWFALAVTFKMFALMVFLPLLLLEEKRLWRIAGASAGACSLSLLSKLLFLRDKMNTPTQFDERRFIRFLFGRNLDLGGATISAFVLLFGATVLVCWLSRMDEQAQPYGRAGPPGLGAVGRAGRIRQLFHRRGGLPLLGRGAGPLCCTGAAGVAGLCQADRAAGSGGRGGLFRLFGAHLHGGVLR